LDELIVLTYLKYHLFINTDDAATLLQLNRDMVLDIIDKMSHPKRGILARKGHTKTVTYHLSKSIARDLIGKAVYSKLKGIDPVRYAELVKEYLHDHGTITNKECRCYVISGRANHLR